MAEVVFSNRARKSLVGILTFASQDNPAAAIYLIDDLRRRVIETLAPFPDAGKKWRVGRRIFTIRRYAIVYRHDVAKGEVVVLDVFGPGMDWR